MWILESEGDLLGGKRIWLRPGTIHVFGRSRSEARELDENGNPFHGINHKSVSRKHATLTTEIVPGKHSLEYRQKSVLNFEDFSKSGSTVDGERLKTKTLNGSTHEIKFGSWVHPIRVRWVDVSLALVYFNKKTAQSGLLDIQGKIEQFDIKLSPSFQGDSTTHVVAAKRNVPDVLEGLVAGAYIVTEAYIGEIVTACTLGESNKAPLEVDFDSSWPDPLKFIPPQSKEPVPRAENYLAPKPERADMFSKFAFVFCFPDQLSSLAKPINRGGGKVILFEDYKEGSSTPQDLVGFMNDVAMRQSSSKSVVFVRIQITEPNANWKTEFVTGLDLIVGRRSVAQNEFLDVILTCDTDTLKKPLEEVHVPSSAPIETPTGTNGTNDSSRSNVNGVNRQDSDPFAAKKEYSSPVKTLSSKRLRYGQAVSRFKGFDDFKVESLPPVSAVPEEDVDEEMDDAEAETIQQEQDEAMQGDAQNMQASKQGTKRARDQSAIDALLPGAANMKRRRIASGQIAESQSAKADSQIKREMKAPPKPNKLFKTRTIPREFEGGEELEEAAERAENRAQEEERTDPLTAEEIRAVHAGMKIENITIRTHPKATKTAPTDRWDSRWNGRKNFKKFKRTGEGPQPIRGTRVTIRLEEARPRDILLGSIRWAGNKKNTQKKKSQPTRNYSDSEDESQFRRRDHDFSGITNPEDVSDGDFSDHDVGDISLDLDVLPSRARQKANGNTDSHQSRDSRRVLVPSFDSPNVKKRAAPERSTTEASPPPKRIPASVQTSRSSRFKKQDNTEESDDSEEELKFKSRRRKA